MSNPTSSHELSFTDITYDNLELAVSVQNQIFPAESARVNYLESITGNPYRREVANWLVFSQAEPVGVIGLYSYHEYPETAWLGWFGVLEKYRGLGYGSAMFLWWVQEMRERGYQEARLYTNPVENAAALAFYRHHGMTSEAYTNPQESEEVRTSTMLFSLSLTEQVLKPWNNALLELTAQREKEAL